MEDIVLHSCCAPCSAPIVEWLSGAGFRPTVFYFNPNIAPVDEYLRRRDECRRWVEARGLEFVEGDRDHDGWLVGAAGLEGEPERGARCLECFRSRLGATARFAAGRGIPVFTTTLAGSRWKSLDQIRRAGLDAASTVGGVRFWDKDWKKGGLTERRAELLRLNGFYNQTWCGCEFSDPSSHLSTQRMEKA